MAQVGAKSTSCSRCLRYPPGIPRVEGRGGVQGGVVTPLRLSEQPVAAVATAAAAAAAADDDDGVVVSALTASRAC